MEFCCFRPHSLLSYLWKQDAEDCAYLDTIIVAETSLQVSSKHRNADLVGEDVLMDPIFHD